MNLSLLPLRHEPELSLCVAHPQASPPGPMLSHQGPMAHAPNLEASFGAHPAPTTADPPTVHGQSPSRATDAWVHALRAGQLQSSSLPTALSPPQIAAVHASHYPLISSSPIR